MRYRHWKERNGLVTLNESGPVDRYRIKVTHCRRVDFRITVYLCETVLSQRHVFDTTCRTQYKLNNSDLRHVNTL